MFVCPLCADNHQSQFTLDTGRSLIDLFSVSFDFGLIELFN